jgi:hypothetical protein
MGYGQVLRPGDGSPDSSPPGSAGCAPAASSAAAVAFVCAGLHHVPPPCLGHLSFLHSRFRPHQFCLIIIYPDQRWPATCNRSR